MDDVVFKFPAATLAGAETLTGRMKMDAKRERGPMASRWVVQGDVEFHRRGGRWLLRRFQGTEVKTEEGARRFPDVTVPLGLPIAPGDDDRDRTSITFGRLFLGGIAAGDFDGDGLVDLFVPQTGQDLLFRNTGGKFVECARDRPCFSRTSESSNARATGGSSKPTRARARFFSTTTTTAFSTCW